MVNRDIMQLNIVLPVGKPQLDSGYVYGMHRLWHLLVEMHTWPCY